VYKQLIALPLLLEIVVFQLLINSLSLTRSMTEKDLRITEIVNRLDSLTLEANTLTRELKTLREEEEDTTGTTRAHAATNNNEDETNKKKGANLHGFKKGDRVRITNIYRGQRGTEGTVTYVTKSQVTLRDDTGRLHTRKFTNIRKTGN
jgi:hypothetical protein